VVVVVVVVMTRTGRIGMGASLVIQGETIIRLSVPVPVLVPMLAVPWQGCRCDSPCRGTAGILAPNPLVFVKAKITMVGLEAGCGIAMQCMPLGMLEVLEPPPPRPLLQNVAHCSLGGLHKRGIRNRSWANCPAW